MNLPRHTDPGHTPDAGAPLAIEHYAALVAALYRGPFQESPWTDFLGELRAALWPCLAVIGLRLPSPGDAGLSYVGGADLTPQDHLSFANKYSALDPLTDLPDGVTVALDDVISRRELQKTTFYRAFMKPFKQAQIMGFDIHRSGKVALFLRVIRGHGEADFNARDRAVLELLKPQFRELANWMEDSSSHAREHFLYEQASSSLALGTVILDAGLRVVYRNRVAEQLLKNNAGIACIAGRLRVMRHQSQLQLQQALDSLRDANSPGVPQVIAIRRGSGQSPLFITLKRLPQQNRLDDSHHIAVYMTDPEIRQIDQTQLVVDAFGLTQQEARLVIVLANGGTLEGFARDIGISKNTARTHLYSTFRKVGVSQQSALVSHVIRAIHGL